MTKAQEEALKKIEARNEFGFGCLPQEWMATPMQRPEPIWFPYYDLEGMLNVAIVQANGEISREVKN